MLAARMTAIARALTLGLLVMPSVTALAQQTSKSSRRQKPLMRDSGVERVVRQMTADLQEVPPIR